MPRPFEGNEPPVDQPIDPPQSRPLPCPNCDSRKGYSRQGNFRVQCLACNSLIPNEHVGMELTPEENS